MIVSQMPKTNKKRREMQIMDLIKIGKYISGKRKELGLTQKQLAEKLDKSDKSVSKWERGICLPDVSVYMELCSILNITINEFLDNPIYFIILLYFTKSCYIFPIFWKSHIFKQHTQFQI